MAEIDTTTTTMSSSTGQLDTTPIDTTPIVISETANFLARYNLTEDSFALLLAKIDKTLTLFEESEKRATLHGDTGFMIACAALVFFMTPGLGYFYSGMARSKTALSLILLCFLSMAVVLVQVKLVVKGFLTMIFLFFFVFLVDFIRSHVSIFGIR